MGYAKVIEYKGKQIVEMDFQDYSYKDLETIKQIAEEGKKLVSSQPLNSVITLTNVVGLKFSAEIMDIFKELTTQDKPYVKYGAIIGIIGLQKVAYEVVMKVSGRRIPTFDSREKALEWLAEQTD